MQKPAKVQDKYYLRSLHQEIDLYDRKLAHLARYGEFANDEERDETARKLTVKRNTLAVAARRLASEGIEFNSTELPRSFRPETEAAVEADSSTAAAPAAPQNMAHA